MEGKREEGQGEGQGEGIEGEGRRSKMEGGCVRWMNSYAEK